MAGRIGPFIVSLRYQIQKKSKTLGSTVWANKWVGPWLVRDNDHETAALRVLIHLKAIKARCLDAHATVRISVCKHDGSSDKGIKWPVNGDGDIVYRLEPTETNGFDLIECTFEQE